jgi:hypothetical protein
MIDVRDNGHIAEAHENLSCMEMEI